MDGGYLDMFNNQTCSILGKTKTRIYPQAGRGVPGAAHHLRGQLQPGCAGVRLRGGHEAQTWLPYSGEKSQSLGLSYAAYLKVIYPLSYYCLTSPTDL